MDNHADIIIMARCQIMWKNGVFFVAASIVFVANSGKAGAASVCSEAMRIASEKGYRCYSFDPACPPSDEVLKDTVFLAAIGGDGTILKTVPFATAHDLPILGINLGRVGFLSEILPSEFPSILDMLQAGSLHIERRMMIRCNVNGSHTYHCLNDVLLYKQSFSGVAHISLCIDGADAGTVFCDGMIVSTPTGSTGYSISAGGPIVSPGLDACIIAPVCPHSLLARPIVASADAKLELRMLSDGCLYADGQKVLDVDPDDTVFVTRSEIQAKFLRVGAHNLYDLIREKLI